MRRLPADGSPLRRQKQSLETVLRLVVYQQISLKAAGAIWSRLAPAVASPESIAAIGEGGLLRLGLSRPKARYVTGIAQALGDKSFEFARMPRLSDDEARAALLELPGIGPWSAEIYLLSALGRADAFPAGDLALQEAAKRALGLKVRPSTKEFERLAEAWRPHRSAAARLLWAYYRAAKEF